VHQIDQIVKDDGGGLAGGADLAGSGGGDDAVRLAGTGAGGELGVGDATKASG
jgi:hypothetical protein